MKRVAVLCLALLAAGCGNPKHPTVTDESARAMIVAQFKARGVKNASSLLDMDVQPFGARTKVVKVTFRGMMPVSITRWIVDAGHGARPVEISSLLYAFQTDYPCVRTEHDKVSLANLFVQLIAVYHQEIIDSTNDIPGYDNAPLDPDLAQSVRAPFHIGEKSYVLFTYQQIGGHVRRYRFTFRLTGVLDEVDCLELGSGIGEARYRL
ncbi:hypothetical protein JW905_02715 [bacterium]|nr:hypothetical protein [candidate division CSSED10-310 bacterium]